MTPRRWAILAMALALAWCADAGARGQSRKHPRLAPIATRTKTPSQAHAKTAPKIVEDVAVDDDFERRAAELRAWLRQREEQRRLEGDIGDGIPDEYVTPLGGIIREHKAKTAPGHEPAVAPTASGRQRHVLDPSQPIVLRGTRVTIPAKAPATTRKSPAPHKKAR